jgi:hypothetical protein
MLDSHRIFWITPTFVRRSIARFQDLLVKPATHTSSDGNFESDVSDYRSDVVW